MFQSCLAFPVFLERAPMGPFASRKTREEKKPNRSKSLECMISLHFFVSNIRTHGKCVLFGSFSPGKVYQKASPREYHNLLAGKPKFIHWMVGSRCDTKHRILQKAYLQIKETGDAASFQKVGHRRPCFLSTEKKDVPEHTVLNGSFHWFP